MLAILAVLFILFGLVVVLGAWAMTIFAFGILNIVGWAIVLLLALVGGGITWPWVKA